MGKLIIIIGAGASGLQAGRKLSKAGYAVTILEASAVPGGRIHTLPPGGPEGFSVTVEGGAEFIHGELPLSLGLAREAGVRLDPVNAQMVRGKAGEGEQEYHQGWDELYKQMEMLAEDMPFADFLERYFSEARYAPLRQAAGRMAEGYDLADLATASTLSLYREWSAEEHEEAEYRPAGGYRQLIDHLVSVCVRQGCVIHYSSVVSSVRWERGRVEVHTRSGRVYSGEVLLSTVSLGVLKASGPGFIPGLPSGHREAIQKLGFGSVIKVLLEFDQAFWDQRKPAGKTLFILGDQTSPTWWTQQVEDCPLITGWVSGQCMRFLRALDPAERIVFLLDSLAAMFGTNRAELQRRLKASLLLDWETMGTVLGGYSFETVGGAAARAALSEPVAGTLFFGGEGLYEGDVPGTVEAAFCHGLTIAEKIIAMGMLS